MLNHLIELRRRCLYTLIYFGLFFGLFFFLANDLLYVLIKPLLNTLAPQQSLIATHITSPLFTPLKLAADAALLLSAPIALFHLWRFVSPGLYLQERRILQHALILSLILFTAGLLFCFYLVLPLMFYCFTHALPKEVYYLPDITSTVGFITQMLVLFGFCFQVPLLCWLLVRLNIISLTNLKKIRPYIIVAAFILGMILTPPDVPSQIMLALPLCLLYEVGIVLAIFFV